MTIAELQTKREEKLARMRALLTDATKENRDLKPSERQEFIELDIDVQDMAADISTAQRRLESGGSEPKLSYINADRGHQGETWRDDKGNVVPIVAKAQSYARAMNEGREPSFGFGEFIKAAVTGRAKKPEIQAALSEGTNSAGGFTVPTILLPALIDLMRAKTNVVQAGAVTVPLTSDIVNIARISADPTPAWRSEAAAFAIADPTFEQVQFKPQSLGVVVKVSMELLEDSVNINEALQNCFAGAFAVEVDRVAMFGTGVLPQPHGIAGTANVGNVSMGANGAALTNYDPFCDALSAILTANASYPTAAIMAPRTLTKIGKLKDVQNQPLRRPEIIQNLPFLPTSSVPITQTQGTSNVSSEIIVGDYTQLMLGIRHRMRVTILQERFFADNGQIGFVADLRADVQLRHPQSFCEIVGVL